jgi:aryl-alcohol dehydrogenase-like predicted oxidoreductase
VDIRTLGNLWPVSALTIGGGGLGQVWGPTSREEAVATLRDAIDGGITLIDVAPSYGEGEAESVVGDAFAGRLPDGVRVCSKVHLGGVEPSEVDNALRLSLDESLRRMRIDHVDLFLLHGQIVPVPDPERSTWTTPLGLYEEADRPALQRLVDEGRIGAWGITAVQFPEVLESVFTADPTPQVAQMIANLLDSPGDMAWTDDIADPRRMARWARDRGIGAMGIRAVQAGALTDSLDRDLEREHPAMVDFERAAPLRVLANELGESTATLAHHYALTMDEVDTVVLGVKNREELAECLRVADLGPLPEDVMRRVEGVMAPLREAGHAG